MAYNVYIYGASNPQTLALVRRSGYNVVGYVDDNEEGQFHNIEIIRPEELPSSARVINSVSKTTDDRRNTYLAILAANGIPQTFVDRDAKVYTSKIGPGCYIQERTSIQAGAELRRNVTVHSGAMVGERVTLGAHCFVGPGAQLLGRATYGKGVYIGANAVVLPDVTVGDWATIGAGAVVTKDVPAGTTVVGVPGREHKVPTYSPCVTPYCHEPAENPKVRCEECLTRYVERQRFKAKADGREDLPL